LNCIIQQLCGAGAITDIVHGLRREGKKLTEEVIAYILRETIEVIST